MATKRRGNQTVVFENGVHISGFGSIGAVSEQQGPLGEYLDIRMENAEYGEDSYEKAEMKMFRNVALHAIEKFGYSTKDIDFLIGGDLLNQIVSAGYSARELEIPFLGIFGACSTMCEALLLGAMLVDGGFADNVVCATSSHFGTAERQFRFPLELGTPKPPSGQITATAAGATVLSGIKNPFHLAVKCATVGRVIDFGITDPNNMGAAMAPAAAETIVTHFEETGRRPDYYDKIITGDLGSFGTHMMFDLISECGFDLGERHEDCGKMIYRGLPNINCGASGCGCMGSSLNGYFMKSLIKGDYTRLLFVATGALMSPTTSLQGESIPSIAHAVAIEKEEE